jgi:glucose-fructose oxidoreductase
VKAAGAGIHVLCEKPMAVTAAECRRMIETCRRHGVKLMIAYRLHFEPANLRAIELATSGKLGPLRGFQSLFTMQVRAGDVRLERPELGGGPLYDIGIYCINAVRNIFRDEPEEVFAVSSRSGDPRFAKSDETISAIMRFPDDRLADFTCSFGSSDIAAFQVVGTKGHLRLDPAFEYAAGLRLDATINGKTRRTSFAKRDQFAAELLHFSDCVLGNREPEPSGEEGLVDVQIIEALHESLEQRAPVKLRVTDTSERPTAEQIMARPPVQHPPEPVHAESPSVGP